MSLGARPRYVGTRWYLDLNQDGTVDVSKRGRVVAPNLSPAAARRYLHKNMGRGDRAFQVEPDGYRTPL